MPLFFFIVGFLLIDSGVRGNAKAVGGQIATDVQGFLAFGAAIIILGIVGMSPSARPVAKSLLVLIFVTFIIKNGNQIVSGLTSAAKATSAPDSTALATPSQNAGLASSNSAPNGTSAGSKDYSGYINTAESLFQAYEGMG